MNLDNISIGVDIEDVSRFRGKSLAFYEKIFTVRERNYCDGKQIPEQHYAVRFCAKEAFIKALCGLGQRGADIPLTEIEICHDTAGCPMISYEKGNGIASRVSLSHDQTKAIAYVIVLKS